MSASSSDRTGGASSSISCFCLEFCPPKSDVEGGGRLAERVGVLRGYQSFHSQPHNKGAKFVPVSCSRNGPQRRPWGMAVAVWTPGHICLIRRARLGRRPVVLCIQQSSDLTTCGAARGTGPYPIDIGRTEETRQVGAMLLAAWVHAIRLSAIRRLRRPSRLKTRVPRGSPRSITAAPAWQRSDILLGIGRIAIVARVSRRGTESRLLVLERVALLGLRRGLKSGIHVDTVDSRQESSERFLILVDASMHSSAYVFSPFLNRPHPCSPPYCNAIHDLMASP
jgi:hypothetical protein